MDDHHRGSNACNSVSRMETAAVTVSPIPSSVTSVSVPIELVHAATGLRPTRPTTTTTSTSLVPNQYHISSAGPNDLSATTVYVDANGDLVAHNGMQLTTITVAVPAPLSPTDPALLQAAANAAAAGTSYPPASAINAVCQLSSPPQSHHHHLPPPLHSAPSSIVQHATQTTVTLPTVPAPQESTFKWKYEQSKDKTGAGTSLVRPLFMNDPAAACNARFRSSYRSSELRAR
jgi:hypothetical protein